MSLLAMTVLDYQLCDVMFSRKNNRVLRFSKRPPTLTIPSTRKGFKLSIGLDRGKHFFSWFPETIWFSTASSAGRHAGRL